MFDFYLQFLADQRDLSLAYVSIIFECINHQCHLLMFTCCQVTKSFPCEKCDTAFDLEHVGNLERHFCEFYIYFSDFNVFNIFRIIFTRWMCSDLNSIDDPIFPAVNKLNMHSRIPYLMRKSQWPLPIIWRIIWR